MLRLRHQGEYGAEAQLILNLQKLMINDNLNTATKLQMALIVAEVLVSSLPKDTPYQSFELR